MVLFLPDTRRFAFFAGCEEPSFSPTSERPLTYCGRSLFSQIALPNFEGLRGPLCVISGNDGLFYISRPACTPSVSQLSLWEIFPPPGFFFPHCGSIDRRFSPSIIRRRFLLLFLCFSDPLPNPRSFSFFSRFFFSEVLRVIR